jgi:Cu/Ag efflux protein CusF
MKSVCRVLVAAAAACACAAQAQMAPAAQPLQLAQAAKSELYEGQVRRVNRETGRVTLTHGPLAAFNMGPMTMAFPVKDPAMLAGIKEGDKVRFALQAQGDNLVVTRIETVK